MIWPFLMLFGVVMAIVFRSKVAACVVFAWAVTQFLQGDMLLKFALWQMVGTFIMFKLREYAAGAFVIASGLCYPIANAFSVEAAVGSLPFVLSDILVVLAVMIGSSGGLVSRFGGKRIMGWSDNRRGDCYNYRNTRVEEEA